MKKILFVVLSLVFFSSIDSLGQTVYKTRTGKKYHTSSHYPNSTPISLPDALKQGLGPCSVCKPSNQVKTENNEVNTLTSPTDNSTQRSTQSTDKIKSSSSTASKQCMGTTKAGQRCKRTTTDPSGYYYQHKE